MSEWKLPQSAAARLLARESADAPDGPDPLKVAAFDWARVAVAGSSWWYDSATVEQRYEVYHSPLGIDTALEYMDDGGDWATLRKFLNGDDAARSSFRGLLEETQALAVDAWHKSPDGQAFDRLAEAGAFQGVAYDTRWAEHFALTSVRARIDDYEGRAATGNCCGTGDCDCYLSARTADDSARDELARLLPTDDPDEAVAVLRLLDIGAPGTLEKAAGLMELSPTVRTLLCAVASVDAFFDDPFGAPDHPLRDPVTFAADLAAEDPAAAEICARLLRDGGWTIEGAATSARALAKLEAEPVSSPEADPPASRDLAQDLTSSTPEAPSPKTRVAVAGHTRRPAPARAKPGLSL